MKTLIIGASGLVGSHVFEEATTRGHEVVGTYRNFPIEGLQRLDLADEDATRELMSNFKPDWVVHAAGWTWVDGCEQDTKRAFRENCEQPARLARLCRELGSRFAYFSSTYVFDGTQGPYSEGDTPNPINVYGKSKWAAEQEIQEVLAGEALIPRVICVWGKEAQRKNFVYQAIKALNEGRLMKIPSDQIGNPTWAGDISWWLAELMAAGERGVWNLTGEDEDFTRAEWFRAIRQGAMELWPKMVPVLNNCAMEIVSTADLRQAALRPLMASGSNKRVQTRFPKKMRGSFDISPLEIHVNTRSGLVSLIV